MSGPRSLVAWFDRFLFGQEPAGRVRATRAGLALIVAVRVAFGPYRGLADQPPALFRPVWFLQLLDAMPSVEVIVAAQIFGTAAALLAVLGWRERGTLLVAFTSLLFLAGLRASRGKIQHNDVVLLLVVVVFLVAPVGQRLLDRRRSTRFGWPIRTSLTIVALAYFLTGFQKLVTSGPAWILSDNMRNVMYTAPMSGKAPTAQLSSFIAEQAWLSHLVAAATIGIEIGFLAILVWPRVRPLFVVASIALHSSIWLTHGLDYSAWAAVVVVVLIDWSAVAARVRRPNRGYSMPARTGSREGSGAAPPSSPSPSPSTPA
jgi:hypothetical protein